MGSQANGTETQREPDNAGGYKVMLKQQVPLGYFPDHGGSLVMKFDHLLLYSCSWE